MIRLIQIKLKIDLSDSNILYHLFHEAPRGCYPINTGVKFVNKKAIIYEQEIWSVRNQKPWNQFPYEQKATYEFILPKISNKYIIHDPYKLNCISEAYPQHVDDALFVHMCGMPENKRNIHITNFVNNQP